MMMMMKIRFLIALSLRKRRKILNKKRSLVSLNNNNLNNNSLEVGYLALKMLIVLL